ncbi:MAG: 50S ribosomal protein L22 [Nitrospinae bacterium]|nr:50S ribosomal protein L22 [Nitrospinota bacterium]
MQAKAVLRYIHISPRKTRLVADLIRGKNVNDALNILTFTQKASARILERLLKSAIANAEAGKKVKDVDSLIISQIKVDGGSMWKRFMPRARGRTTPIRKRTSHITIVLN